jgi:peptidoglycan/xylan/chitin deacetylase (PgdA/CDA1 family)
MKVKITAQFFTLYIFGIVSLSAFAAVEAPYEVGTWGDFAQGALSLTFDDWPTSGATRITTDGRTAFNAKNLHFTMFINTDGISQVTGAFSKRHSLTAMRSPVTTSSTTVIRADWVRLKQRSKQMSRARSAFP